MGGRCFGEGELEFRWWVGGLLGFRGVESAVG